MTGSFFNWAVPESLGLPPDPVKLVLEFHSQAVVMHVFDDLATTKVVSAMDVAHALARELSFSSGLLPKNALWWSNTPDGPVTAIWQEPKVWRVALQEVALGAPRRFMIPMPGLVFLCQSGKAPWVFAAKRRPSRDTDLVYKAPLCNIFSDGRSCPGTHKFPLEVGEIPDSFFRSFFTATADLRDRSKQFPDNIVKLWEHLDGKPDYPLADLVRHGSVQDLTMVRRS